MVVGTETFKKNLSRGQAIQELDRSHISVYDTDLMYC